MLIPILGRSGSGKTTYILDKIKETAKSEEKIMLIVPEQFSFEMEKAVYRNLSSDDALKVEVYSFTRLCNKIFSTYGGMAGERISDAAKQILMSLALENAKDQLTLYAKPANSVSFVSSMLKTVNEFKNAGIMPERLEEFSATTENTQLSQKIDDLSHVYLIYQSLLEASYLDEKDDLLKCCALLEGEGFFSDYIIFIDSFMTFMAGEMKMIKLMLSSCKALYLAMPTDGLSMGFLSSDEEKIKTKSTNNSAQNEESESISNGTFDIVKQTTLQIIHLAKEENLKVLTPVKLDKQYRFTAPELVHLEKWIDSTSPEIYQGTAESIKVVKARNPFDEVEYVAAEIANLVRTKKISYKEIAVIGRTMEPYTTAIEDLFPKFDIPFFMDLREDIQSIPLISAVLSALEAVRSNYDTQFMLALGKSTLLGIDCTKIAQLENYCYIWTLNHKQWVDGTGFQNNPRGLVNEFTEADKIELSEIQSTAESIAAPIKNLKETIAQCTGGEFAKAVFDFLLAIHARENMTVFANSTGEVYSRYTQLNQGAWDILMDVLDIFYTTMKQIILPQDKMIDLLKMGIVCSDIGSIPNTLDQVAVGTADRMRPNKPKVTFVIGANQGEFPPQLSENGLFSDTERDELFDGGIKLNPSVLRRSSYEKYFIYAALTSPSQRLIVTYHSALLKGEITPKATFVSDIETMFAKADLTISLSTEELSPEFFIANKRTAFDQLCRLLRNDTPFTASLMQCINDTEYSPRLKYILSVLQDGGFSIHDREIAKMLFGQNMRLSPSKVENYFLCPFSYFCSGGLNLKARRKVEFSPMQSGTTIHFVLEKMVSKHGGKGLSLLNEEEIKDEVTALLNEFLKNRIAQEEVLTKRFSYLFKRLANTLTRLLVRLGCEFAQSSFEPFAFEMPITKNAGMNPKATPLELCAIDGQSISIEGVVDRVDIMKKDGVSYVRVVDYKSGSKEFRLEDVYSGLNLQMLIYLFSIWQNGKGELEGCLPAGVLYMPAKDSIISAQRNTSDVEIEKAHQKKYKMNGLVLDNQDCIEGMEAKVEGLFIPVKEKSDGTFDAHSSVASLEEMGNIKAQIEKILIEMAESLLHGEVPAQPNEANGYEPCKYCDYKTICQRCEKI